MSERKWIFIVLIFSFCVFPLTNAKAEEKNIYYINEHGVEFTKEEYDFISQFYWYGYQNEMNLEDYQEFIDSEIINGDIETVELNNCLLRSSEHTTANKSLKITKSCSSNCTISVVVTWSSIPSTKSYDVIGAYLENVSLITNPTTKAFTSVNTNLSSEIKKTGNGFGVSILLPSAGTNYIVNQTYVVSKGGTVYASYQHAKKSISLESSKGYSISRLGYGGVFDFNRAILSTYDGMKGVSITV